MKKRLLQRTRWHGCFFLGIGLAGVQGCSPEPLAPDPGRTSPVLVRLSVGPRFARLVPGDSVGLFAYGHFRNGDSALAPVAWIA